MATMFEQIEAPRSRAWSAVYLVCMVGGFALTNYAPTLADKFCARFDPNRAQLAPGKASRRRVIEPEPPAEPEPEPNELDGPGCELDEPGGESESGDRVCADVGCAHPLAWHIAADPTPTSCGAICTRTDDTDQTEHYQCPCGEFAT